MLEGNNHKLVAKFLRKRGLEPLESGMNLTDKARFRWTHKPSEINYRNFVEGKHVVNHISNSNILTNKFKLFKTLNKLGNSLRSGRIHSNIYTSPKQFMVETYLLNKNNQLAEFFLLPNEGKWILKNTSQIEGENQVTLINNIDAFKRSMLLKVKRNHRPLLEAMIGKADKSLMAGFVDDSEDEAPCKTKVTSPTKAATIKSNEIGVDEERKRAVTSALTM